mmetsp:Transcript_32369/g.78968  ORF Transcript_32369/g.78968 Transcript_32369/m.78968 type:complete len:111 (-) Transcript_32369:673-1005(-)
MLPMMVMIRKKWRERKPGMRRVVLLLIMIFRLLILLREMAVFVKLMVGLLKNAIVSVEKLIVFTKHKLSSVALVHNLSTNNLQDEKEKNKTERRSREGLRNLYGSLCKRR